MPPTAPRKLTANPSRPARYFPGRATAPESESESSDSGDEEAEQTEQTQEKPTSRATQAKETTQSSRPAPAASSFPSRPAPQAKPPVDEAEFETEDEADSGSEEESGSEEGSSSEEESSEDDRDRLRRQLLRPTFVKKEARAQVVTLNGSKANGTYDADEEAAKAALEEERKKERADDLVQTQIELNAAARAAGKKYWDDEDIVDEIDDTDDLEPDAEYAAWKLRELTRVKRDRDALIAAEKEREEIERRRNLTKEEREAEDQAYISAQKAEQDGKGNMGYMQRYFHQGAFFNDDLKAAGLAGRDVMGGKYADDVVNREMLPEYMQIRDMAKLGRKGRTRYKDMRSEDTGRFGETKGKRREGDGLDERFRADDWGGQRDRERERTGANASALGERKRGGEDGERRGGDEKRPRFD